LIGERGADGTGADAARTPGSSRVAPKAIAKPLATNARALDPLGVGPRSVMADAQFDDACRRFQALRAPNAAWRTSESLSVLAPSRARRASWLWRVDSAQIAARRTLTSPSSARTCAMLPTVPSSRIRPSDDNALARTVAS